MHPGATGIDGDAGAGDRREADSQRDTAAAPPPLAPRRAPAAGQPPRRSARRGRAAAVAPAPPRRCRAAAGPGRRGRAVAADRPSSPAGLPRRPGRDRDRERALGGRPAGAQAGAAAQADRPDRPAPAAPSYLLLTRTALRNESPEFRTALLTRSARTAADIEAIDDWQAEGRAFAIFPPASVPPVSRLTTDSVLLEAALESGREAVDEVFGG